jgi:hypothetical protein
VASLVITSRPVVDRLCSAHLSASADMSLPNTVASGRSDATAGAIVPQPVQRSATMPLLGSAASALSTTVEVPGRGMNTPGPTANPIDLNGATRVMYWSGSPSTRRWTNAAKAVAASG